MYVGQQTCMVSRSHVRNVDKITADGCKIKILGIEIASVWLGALQYINVAQIDDMIWWYGMIYCARGICNVLLFFHWLIVTFCTCHKTTVNFSKPLVNLCFIHVLLSNWCILKCTAKVEVRVPRSLTWYLQLGLKVVVKQRCGYVERHVKDKLQSLLNSVPKLAKDLLKKLHLSWSSKSMQGAEYWHPWLQCDCLPLCWSCW